MHLNIIEISEKLFEKCLQWLTFFKFQVILFIY